MIRAARSVLATPAVYQLWTKAVGSHKFVNYLVNEHIRPKTDSRVLEIGCGPGTMVPSLPQSGYLGFDLSPEYIEQARKRFPKAQFLCERVSQFSLTKTQEFDVAIAIGIVHHLDDAEAVQLFQIAYAALKPNGRLVTVDGVFTKDQSAAARYLLSRDRGEHVRSQDEYVRIATQVFHDVKPIVRNDLLRIPYTHLILECVRPALSKETRAS